MFKYYFLNRPPDIGTYPIRPGLIETVVWWPRQLIPGTQRYAHGCVTYEQPLTWDDVWRYDLFPEQHLADEYFDWREEEGK